MSVTRARDRGWGTSLVVLLSLALPACTATGEQTTHDWLATYDTIGDTVIVRTESGSVWGDTARLVADLSIGEMEGADEYILGSIRSLAVGTDGTIYAFDRDVPALRVYAPDGTYRATFGREGGGPGEYRSPDGGLAVLSDGRVLLRDPGNARITVYSPEGESLDTWRVLGGLYTSRRLYRDTSDNVYTYVLLNPRADFPDWVFGIVRIGPDGAMGDTIDLPDWNYNPPEISASSGEGDDSRVIRENVPFSPIISWAYSPLGYMVGGLSTRYAISLFLEPGNVLRIERSDWQPVPVLTDERDEQERIMTATMRQVDPGWRWNGQPIPDTKPPFSRFFVAEDGRIWVQLHEEGYQVETEVDAIDNAGPGHVQVPPRTWFEPVAFDVFEPDGRYLGMVRAPEGFSMNPTPVARGDTLWAVVRDEMEVPYIVRFRIEHGVAGTP